MWSTQGRIMEEHICLNCGKHFIPSRNSFGTYCSNKCQLEFQYKEYIDRWKKGLESGMRGKYSLSKHIQRYILEKYHYKCSKCGWGEENPSTHRVPLEVHHIDGNYLNNAESNLEALCPNCHSLTDTYKNNNGHKGREGRK